MKPKFINTLCEKLNKEESSQDSWKYFETSGFWNLRNSETLLRIHKTKILPENYSVDLKLVNDEIEYHRQQSSDLNPEIRLLTKEQPLPISPPLSINEHAHFVLKMKFIPEKHLMNNILKKNKFNEKHLELLMIFLEKKFEEAPIFSSRQYHHASEIETRANDLFYQSEKHKNLVVTKSTLDLIKIPFYRFLQDHEKDLQQRYKAKAIIETQGCIDPEHTYLQKDRVSISPKISLSKKDANKDFLEDLASLQVEIAFHDNFEMADKVLEKFFLKNKDTRLSVLNPFFKIIKCLERGLEYTVLVVQDPEDTDSLSKAKKYYKLATGFVKEMGISKRTAD